MADHIHTQAEGTGGLFARLFETYVPRRHCMFYEADVIWTHLVSDLLIALAYFSIPVALVYFARRRKDLAYNWMFLLFALFIVLCGTTHVFNIIALWQPLYRLDGIVKFLTGLASVGTAIALYRLIPAALALPSPEQLRRINDNLSNEIAERKRAEDELRKARDGLERRVSERTAELHESEERFRTLAESVSQLVWMARPDGHIFWYNRRWYEYTGTTPEQMEGWGWKSVHDPEQLPKVVERWTGSIKSGEPFEMVFPLRGADGTFRPFLTRVMPTRDGDGRIAYWCGTNTDITAHVEMEERLREADRRKDEFLAMLAHELRNPLSSVNNAVQLIGRTDADDAREWALDVIRRNVKKLGRLIDDLLDVSRITRGLVELRMQSLDASSAIESALEVVRPLVEEKKQRLTARFERGTLWCEADPLRLEQILVNLLYNAAHYTQNEGHIWLSAAREGSELIIKVGDDGVGIPAPLLPRVFDLFVQGERSLARSEGGLGIGLTIVRKLAEMHGGSVAAASDGPGRGSEFTVRLPASERHPAAGRDGTPAPERARPAGRILIVDDNVDTANTLARFLKLLGHETRTAYDGPSAVAAARDYRPDIVLLDIGLPGMSGYEVAQALRNEPSCRDALIIAVTGYGKDEDRERSRQSGFDHHLVKPIDHTTLIKLLSRADSETA